MAVSVMSRSAGLSGLNTGSTTTSRRGHGQASRGPMRVVARAFCRPGKNNFYNQQFDDESMKRMVREMEAMSKQWRETGKVNGGFFFPGVGGFYAGGSSSPSSSPSSSASTLALDLVTTDSCYQLYADIPGLSKADLSIKISKERVLTISGERQPPVEEGFSQQERRYGPFERRWALPEDAESQGISAKVTEGVLTITIPKKTPEPEVDDSQEITIN